MAYTRRRAFIAAATFLVRARCRCHVSCTAGVMLHGACVAVPCVARLVCGLGLRRCSRRADASPLACAGSAVYGTLLSLSRIRGVWCPTAVDGVRSHVRAGLGGASAFKRKLLRDRGGAYWPIVLRCRCLLVGACSPASHAAGNMRHNIVQPAGCPMRRRRGRRHGSCGRAVGAPGCGEEGSTGTCGRVFRAPHREASAFPAGALSHGLEVIALAVSPAGLCCRS